MLINLLKKKKSSVQASRAPDCGRVSSSKMAILFSYANVLFSIYNGYVLYKYCGGDDHYYIKNPPTKFKNGRTAVDVCVRCNYYRRLEVLNYLVSYHF